LFRARRSFASQPQFFSLSSCELSDLIREHGGEVSNIVHRKVSYVVASEQAIRRNTQVRTRCNTQPDSNRCNTQSDHTTRFS
jgi:hypothetical protein